MRKIVFLFLVQVSFWGFSQEVPTRFSQLPHPLKTWVIFHPFKAKSAQLISREAYRVTDSIKNSNLLDADGSGGQVDAFRHGYWMARLHQAIGKKAAISLGKAYEKANKLQFEKGTLEEGMLPDQISSEMDVYNNQIGVALVTKKSNIPKAGLIYRVINSILAGDFKIVKKDKRGRFLDCTGAVILPSKINLKWKSEKCLIPSNQTFE